MTRTNSSRIDGLVEESRSRIEEHPNLNWTEVVEELVDEAVNRRYSSGALENILSRYRPHDEWQIYCNDITDIQEVKKAMAYVAIREEIIEELRDEFED